MPIDDLNIEARKNFQLRQKEELECIKCQIESERISAKRKKADHERFLQERLLRERSTEVQRCKRSYMQPPPNLVPSFETLDKAMEAGALAP